MSPPPPNALNNVSVIEYDDLNRPILIGTPHPITAGSTLDTTIAYTPTLQGWSTLSTNPLGNTILAESDMLGRTTRVSGTATSTQTWDYWMDGRLKSTTDELGRTTDFLYDQRGRLLSYQAPAPTVGASRPTTSFTYSLDSLLTSTIDPMGRVTSYEYDNGGRVSRVVSPDPDGPGPQTAAYQRFIRDSVGNVLQHTDSINEATGHWTVNTYDAWFRPLTSTDPVNAVTTKVYDVFGNVTRITDAKSNITDYTYNKLNQLVTEKKGTNRTYSYDANGNLRSYTDRNNRTTTFQYDRRNRLTSEAWGSTRTLDYSYDVGDRLVGILDSDALSLDFQFAYDTRGQLQAERQYGSSYLLSRSILFDRSYDSVGNLTQLRANINGTISGQTVTGGIDDFVNTHTYDAMNRRIQTTQSGTATGNAVAAKTATFQYNAASQLTDVRRYNAVSPVANSLQVHTRNDFDGAGRLAGITHAKQELASGVVWNGLSNTSSVGIVAAYRFAYDSDNRLTQFSSFADNLRTNYTYDRVDQLTGTSTSIITGMVAPYIPTDETYSYDATGNRLSSTGTSQSSNGSHNRLQTDGTYNYLYDNEGNTTRRTHIATGAVTNYTWDHRNRLATVVERISVSGAITKQTQFTYDAFDNRVAKRVDVDGNGTWDRYEVTIWAEGQEVMRLVDSDGAGSGQTLRLANRYLWADAVDQLLSDEQYLNNTGMAINASTKSTVSGNTLWTLGDHLGSIRDLLDNNGVIREHQVFDSYGRLVHEVDYNASGQVIASNDPAAVDTVFGYTGRFWDSDINLQYNRARWYDPQTGRWLSQDPIGFAGLDVNLYRYVGNHPTYSRDPSGLKDPDLPKQPRGMIRIELNSFIPGRLGGRWLLEPGSFLPGRDYQFETDDRECGEQGTARQRLIIDIDPDFIGDPARHGLKIPITVNEGPSGRGDGDGIDIYIISGTSGRKPVDGSDEEADYLRATPRAGATPMRVSNQNGYPHDQIIINAAGSNPFFTAAPAINTYLNFHQMRLPNGDILLDFAGNLDVFPDHELIITPYGGERTTVQCWKTTRSGPISLAEPPTQQIRVPIVISGNKVITGPEAQKRVPGIGR